MVVLVFLLVILSGAAFFLVQAVAGAAARGVDREQTSRVLAAAKQALLGYAAGRADDVGYLPCPDTAYNGPPFDPLGSGNTPCGPAGQPSMGLFPWGTLEAPDARDGAGASLWYAVSGKHKINPATVPLNSDVPGTLSADGDSDIVAVLLAPGAPVPNQARSGSPFDATQFLEGDNQTVADNSFTSGAFANDTILTITRRELLAAVEQRVAGAVVRTLNEYFDDYDAYPWLSPFAQPDLAAFKGAVGVREGQLPFHFAEDPNPGPGEDPFATAMTMTWNLANAAVVTLEDGDTHNDIPVACAETSNCVDPDFGAIVINAAATDGSCRWWDPVPAAPPAARDYVRCTAVVAMSVDKQFDPGMGPAVAGRLTRTYTFTVSYEDTTIDDADITAPGAGVFRTRAVTTTVPVDLDPANDDFVIRVEIEQVHVDVMGMYLPRRDAVRISADDDTSGTFMTAGIRYELDVDGGELPAWLIRGDWHHLVYVAYSNADSPGDPADCDSSGPCVTLRVQRSAPAGPVDLNNHRGLVVLAGPDLNMARPSALPGDYFEDENDPGATPNDVFTEGPVTSAFNDRVRSLGTRP